MPSIETVFKSNNGSRGIMFSVTAKKNITITELWSAFRITGTQNVDIYVRDGGHAKGEAGWVKIKSGALAYVINIGEGFITRIATTLAVDIKAGKTKGFAITTPTDSAIGYSSSSTDFSNDDATIVNGVGFSTLSTYFNYPRILNGRVVYNLTEEPPTQPGDITGIQESLYLTSESIRMNWGASTIQSVAAITYDADIYDGNTWTSVATNVSEVSTSIVIPSRINTDKAKIRVQAKDTVGNKSPYKESQTFSVYEKMLIVQDGDTVKSYKDGVWKVI
ncbi:hypothetical protein [Bacillus thuringiensis]|uniref:hypothetical protein n=1 Tax=Bacillus thuringiensis TaxID=1428 RepID=UPI00366DFD91